MRPAERTVAPGGRFRRVLDRQEPATELPEQPPVLVAGALSPFEFESFLAGGG